jgi:hypothetical protein
MQFDPKWFSDLHTKVLLFFKHLLIGFIGKVVVEVLVTKDPLIFEQVDRFLDRKSP